MSLSDQRADARETSPPVVASAVVAPPADTIPAFWRTAVQAHGDLPLARKDGVQASFAELDAASGWLARGLLAEGVGKGARIGILAPNGPQWVQAWLAANRIGAVAVMLSTFFTAREMAYAVRHADISILICADRYLRHDYAARLEEAFPSLVEADGADPLTLPECPFLRSIWFTSPVDRRWARGSLADLAAWGRASSAFGPELLGRVEAAVTPADLGVMMYTSGSTADPKGVVHTQGVMVRKVLFQTGGNGATHSRVQTGDRLLVPMPFFWVGGFLMLATAIARGASVICVDDHAPRSLLETIRADRATHVGGSEAALRALKDSEWARPGDFEGLKPLTSAQRPFFTGEAERIAMSLGMTETFGPHSGSRDGGLLPPGVTHSVGAALEGVDYKIVDPDTGETVAAGAPGELCVRSPWMMDGMYKRERREVFDADGYYHTGDQCVLPQDGYLRFVSRLGGMIKTAGANVSPDEVEQLIRAHPDVVDTAVLGLPDKALGQMVVAAVVRRSGSQLSEDALQAGLRSQLSSFKVPKRIYFFEFDELPRTPSNKIRKPALAEMIQATSRRD